MDAEHAGDLHYLEYLLCCRTVTDRVLDVQLEPLDVQVRRRGVERDVDELLDLGLERAVVPWVRGELGVRGEQLGIQPERGLSGVSPGPADLDELVLDFLLALRQ